LTVIVFSLHALRHEAVKALVWNSRAIDDFDSYCSSYDFGRLFNSEFYYKDFHSFNWFMLSISLW